MFSFARVPAKTPKQKMNQYPKISEIDIDIISFWRKIYYHKGLTRWHHKEHDEDVEHDEHGDAKRDQTWRH